MRIALGADHRGRRILETVAEHLEGKDHKVISYLSDPSAGTSDYPEAAWLVSNAIASDQADAGVLLCGSGVGMCIAANKVPGVRAAPVHDEVTAEISRAHIDANVICLSADLLGARLIEKIIGIFLRTPFEGGRHLRRLEKIRLIEQGQNPTQPAVEVRSLSGDSLRAGPDA